MFKCRNCGSKLMRVPTIFPVELSGNLLYINLEIVIQDINLSCEKLSMENAECICPNCNKKGKLNDLFKSLYECSRCGKYYSKGTHCIYYNRIICDRCLAEYYKPYCESCSDKKECEKRNREVYNE